MRFAESEYNRIMREYDQECIDAKNYTKQRERYQDLEDSLVAGGIKAIQEYQLHIDSFERKAECNQDYDTIQIAKGILSRVKDRLYLMSIPQLID